MKELQELKDLTIHGREQAKELLLQHPALSIAILRMLVLPS